MQKVSIARSLMTAAAAIAMRHGADSPPAQMAKEAAMSFPGKRQRRRGGVIRRAYHKISSVYIPGGPRCNVKPTVIKNPKIAAHVQMMHERWEREQFRPRIERENNRAAEAELHRSLAEGE